MPVKYISMGEFDFCANTRKGKILKDPDKKRVVENSVKKLKLSLYLAGFAYWPRNGGRERVKAQVLNWLGFDEITFVDTSVGVQALIIASNLYKYSAIVFRGTDQGDGIRDWMKNIDIGHTDFRDVYRNLSSRIPGLEYQRDFGEGHDGFTKPLVKVFDKLYQPLNKYAKQGYKIDVIGHSKGGGEAVNMAYILQNIVGVEIREVHAHAAPRSLDELACDIASKDLDIYRFVNPGDPVTYIPLGFNYRHVKKRMVLERRGIKNDLYDVGEFASNIFRRLGSALRLKFGWGVSKHYVPSYISRVDKIYKKFDIKF